MKKTTNKSEFFNQDRVENSYDDRLKRYLRKKGLDPDVVYTKTKKEIAKILLEKLQREQLRGEEEQEEMFSNLYEKNYLSYGTNTTGIYEDKIINRTLTKKEYEKILDEILKYNSILPITNKRNFDYGYGDGNVILSETTGKMYCVEDKKDRKELIDDYNGYQYYKSRRCGAGYIKAGKKTLIYLPTTRIDVAHPEEAYSGVSINGINIVAFANRGIVDKEYPVTIIPQEGQNMYDFVFMDSNNVQDIISTIKSGGEYPKNYQIFEQSLGKYYMDESGDKQEVIIRYVSDKKIHRSKIEEIMFFTGKLIRFDGDIEESIESEFDRVIGIKKTKKGNYIVLDKYGRGVKWYGDKHPREIEEEHGDQYEYVVGDGNKIEKEYFWKKENIRGRKFIDHNTVYRSGRKTIFNGETGYYEQVNTKISMKEILFDEFGFENDETLALSNLFKIDEYGNFMKISGDDSRYYSFDFEDKRIMFSLYNDKITIMTEYVDNNEAGGNNEADGNIEAFLGRLIRSSQLKEKIYDFIEAQLSNSFDDQVRSSQSKEKTSDFIEAQLSNSFNEQTEDTKIRKKSGNMIFREFGEKVYLGYIIQQSDFNERFGVLRGKGNYEKVVSKKQFNHKGVDYREDYMHKEVHAKTIKEYISHLKYLADKRRKDLRIELENKKLNEKVEFIKDFLKNNEDLEFSLEDSYAVGNCKPGTNRFVNKYGLNSIVTAKEILNNKRFEDMIRVEEFITVILNKIYKTI